MTKEKFVRLSGWALMLAGVILVLGFAISDNEASNFDKPNDPLAQYNYYRDPFGGGDVLYEIAPIILIPSAMLFFTVGMLGLRSRYSEKVGGFGSVGLAIAATGGGIGFVGAIGLYAASVDGGWMAMMLGLLLLLVGLILFGIAAIRKKPLPRGNGLPLLTGGVIFLMPIMSMITGSDDLSGPILATIFALIAAGFIALGYVVQGDAGEELGAA